MATFDFAAWGNAQIGKWVLESGESGVYRGQCTQAVTQLLKDLGYPQYNVARGNGNQVGATMVARGEAVYVGTNVNPIPANEIHIVCLGVGQAGAGHVSVAALGDLLYEQNVSVGGLPTRNYGIGPTYPMRLGRTTESWRATRYHYKLTIDTDYDNIGGDDSGGDPGDNPSGANQNRYQKRGAIIDIHRYKTTDNFAVKNRKKYMIGRLTRRRFGQDGSPVVEDETD